MFLWEPNNTIFPHYVHVMNCSATTKHHGQSRLLDYVWKVLWLRLYSAEDLPTVAVSGHLRANRISLDSSALFCSGNSKAVLSFHILGWCFRLRGLPPIRPGLPGALQSQGLLLVNHDIVHSLVRNTAAWAAALLLAWWCGFPRI